MLTRAELLDGKMSGVSHRRVFLGVLSALGLV